MSLRCLRIVALLVFAHGCGVPTYREDVDAAAVQVGAGSSANEFVSFEQSGYRWVKTKDVSYEAPEAAADASADMSATSLVDYAVSQMPLDWIIAKLTPVMEFQGVEYTLDDESKVRFAKEVRDAAIAEARLDAAGMLDEDVADQPALDSEENGRVGRKLIGADNRTMINNPSSLTPHKMIGVYFNLAKGGCAGTVFKVCNRYTAMTTAHAMHNGTSWLTRQDIRFGHSTAKPSPSGWVGTSCWFRVVPAGWDSNKDRAFDYAIIGFRGNGASCTLSTYDVGVLTPQTVGSGVSGMSGSVTGYPDPLSVNPPPGTWTAPEMFTHLNSTGATSSLGLYPTQLWHQNDTTDGQSGSPYWTNSSGTIRVRGIHWGWDPDNGTNAARRWNSTLDSFCSSGGF